VFCGRVFIFLFQSFPLGDKSSVNLRGEYHVDNITVYDEISKGQTLDTNVYKDVEMAESHSSQANDGSVGAASDPNNVSDRVTSQLKEIKFEAKVQGPDGAAMDMDELYPIFWSLQSYFSSPTKLFDPSNLASFKMGLAAALAKFREGYKESDGRGSSRSLEESKQGVKRKRGAGGESLASSFNPKYLTSRDLFDLEVGGA
jgi:THO complex subunit 1